MEDFAAMMAGQGVVPLAQKSQFNRQKPRHAQSTQTREGVSAVPAPVVDAPEQVAVAQWVSGSEARKTLEIAFGRSINDFRQHGHPTVAVALSRQHGRLVSCQAPKNADADRLLRWADTNNVEVIVMAGRGWKLFLHPKLGAACLADD